MTTGPTKPKSPEGYFQSLTFDVDGNLLADGKALNGVKMDVADLVKQDSQTTGSRSFDPRYGLAGSPYKKPDYSKGGQVSRIGTDEKGNLFAFVDIAARDGRGQVEPVVGLLGAATAGQRSEYKKIPLTGIQLDPARTSRNPGPIKDNDNVYLRQEGDGLYYAEIKRGTNTIGYAYSAYQAPDFALGGKDAAQDNSSRRQGGNAQRGLGSTANKMLLG